MGFIFSGTPCKLSEIDVINSTIIFSCIRHACCNFALYEYIQSISPLLKHNVFKPNALLNPYQLDEKGCLVVFSLKRILIENNDYTLCLKRLIWPALFEYIP